MDTEYHQSSYDYFIDKLINQLTDHIPNMTDKQLERLETYCKAELWDRHNVPDCKIPVSKL